ncbi:hypothetical protein E2C01_067393 [Portunus trituberculatus]|uniref:Uncharacterized protein n=1 Tax=Portunus trituberculatus TaxID=210409 RepID=A0A5B7HTH6_PORTR|nr:hypothetical protein [Portunus trituberculatus]
MECSLHPQPSGDPLVAKGRGIEGCQLRSSAQPPAGHSLHTLFDFRLLTHIKSTTVVYYALFLGVQSITLKLR